MREEVLAGKGKSSAAKRRVGSLSGEIPDAAGVTPPSAKRRQADIEPEPASAEPPAVDEPKADGRVRPIFARDLSAQVLVQETPAKALFEILRETGWVYKTVDFARLLGVRPKNAYTYLSSESTRIRASAETIYAWIRSIQRETDLRVSMTLDDNGVLFAYEGLTGAMVPGLAGSQPVVPGTRRAVEPSWMDEARERRAEARRKNRR
jgi:hypothetical protein